MNKYSEYEFVIRPDEGGGTFRTYCPGGPGQFQKMKKKNGKIILFLKIFGCY